MNYLDRIELAAAEALAEIRRMADHAQAEIKFRAAHFNRSQSQKRRFARQRQQGATSE